uniref:Uncharacterized protein n=1 Tax=Anguilla anguilla TaxID=7936 RepID=A0A0E9S2G3_ANGAN
MLHQSKPPSSKSEKPC